MEVLLLFNYWFIRKQQPYNKNNQLYFHDHKYIQCCKNFCKLKLKLKQ